MRSIVSWCLDRRPVVLLATVLVLLGGIFGAMQLRQQLFPDFDFPFVIATVDAPGMDAETLDETVSVPTERALGAVENVEGVTTIASEGQLRLYVELAYGTDAGPVEDDITKAMADLGLPDAVGDPEFAGGFSDQAVVIATLTAPDGDFAKLSERADELRADLESTEGVARVDLAGTSDPRLDVRLRPAAVAAGVTARQVAAALEATTKRGNAGIVRGLDGVPSGLVVEGPAFEDPADLRALRIGDAGTLGSLADIEEVDAASAGFATSDGKDAIAISVFRTTGEDEVTTVDGALEVLDEVEDELGDGSVEIMYESAKDIRASIKGLVVEGTLGAIFAVVVIFLFLRTLRGTLVAAVSIPTSIVFGILAAWMLGLTINIITLAGLTIAVGRVIDDGIVVLENIYKHLERGASRRRAMIDGTGEVAVAIASSTIATAAVFLPIGLVGGLISEIFLSFSIIVTAALLASLLVAVTVIPVIGSYVLKPSATPHDPDDDLLARLVVPATRFGIRWRWIVLPVAVLSMVGVLALVAAGAVPTQFLPDSGTNQLMGTAQLPPGTSAEEARRLLEPLDKEIGDLDELENVQLTYSIQSGNAAFDPSIGTSTAEFFFTLGEGADAKEAEASLRRFGTKAFPGGFSVMRIENGPPSGTFQVNIDGDDQAKIAAAAGRVQQLLTKRADDWDLVEVEATAAQSVPQVLVRTRPGAPVTPDEVRAAVADALAPADAGTVAGLPTTVASSLRLDGDPKAIGALRVTAADGASYPLADVATFDTVASPAFVNRVEGTLSGSVTARLMGDDAAGTNADIREEVEQLELDGVELDWDQGDQQFVNQMFTDMGIAMLVAITLVFFVLVLFFGSIAHPLTILAPILFSFIGSFGALIITGRALGLPAMIGQLLLIGIIVSNSILLVDAALQLRRQGVPRDEALVRAARLRVRPVLMTAAATIAALTPLSLGISGEGGIISQSLGTVVIGGLVVATLLTLVVVPAVFRIIDRDRPMGPAASDPRSDLPTPPPVTSTHA